MHQREKYVKKNYYIKKIYMTRNINNWNNIQGIDFGLPTRRNSIPITSARTSIAANLSTEAEPSRDEIDTDIFSEDNESSGSSKFHKVEVYLMKFFMHIIWIS